MKKAKRTIELIAFSTALLFVSTVAQAKARGSNCANDRALQQEFWSSYTDMQNVCANQFNKKKKNKRPPVRTEEGRKAQREIEKREFWAEQNLKYKGLDVNSQVDMGDGVANAGDLTQQATRELGEVNDFAKTRCKDLKKSIEDKMKTKCPAMLAKYQKALDKVEKQSNQRFDDQDTALKEHQGGTDKTKQSATQPREIAERRDGADPQARNPKDIPKGKASYYDTPGCGSYGLGPSGTCRDSRDRLRKGDVAVPVGSNYRPNEVIQATFCGRTGCQTYPMRVHDTCGDCTSKGVSIDVWGPAMRAQIQRDTGYEFGRHGFAPVSISRTQPARKAFFNPVANLASPDSEITPQEKVKAILDDGDGQQFQFTSDFKTDQIHRMIASHDFCGAHRQIQKLSQVDTTSSATADSLKAKLEQEMEASDQPSGDFGMDMLCADYADNSEPQF